MQSYPKSLAVPVVGDSYPVKILIRVDFPAPLWPRIHNSSESAASKYIPLTAFTSLSEMMLKGYFLKVFFSPITLKPFAGTP